VLNNYSNLFFGKDNRVEVVSRGINKSTKSNNISKEFFLIHKKSPPIGGDFLLGRKLQIISPG
jgi:hypothetical protein